MSWLDESSSESEVENKLTINKDFEKKYQNKYYYLLDIQKEKKDKS